MIKMAIYQDRFGFN